MSSEPIQVGMIGLGGMGSEHFNKVCANRQFAIAALCSIDNEDSRRRMQERFPAAQRPLVTDNYLDVLDDDRIEAVIISTPEMSHAEISVAALRRGKHVLCEKAMATSLSECDRVIDAVHETGQIFQIGQEYRYAEFYSEFHRSIAEDEIGRLRMLWCNEFVEFDNLFQSWHRLRENNGGLLVTKNCHHFDLFNWMAGVPPVRVFAMGGSDVRAAELETVENPGPIEGRDNAWVVVEYEGGIRACLGLCLFTPAEDLAFGAIGDKGRLESYYPTRMEHRLFKRCGKYKTDGCDVRYYARPPGGHIGVVEELDAFAEAIRSGHTDVFANAYVGRQAVLLGLAAEASIDSGHVIDLGAFDANYEATIRRGHGGDDRIM
jgi:predicted dehydrogenase